MARAAMGYMNRARASLFADLAKDVKDTRVLEAMRRIPRERFVPDGERYAAYQNYPLPIGYGQTISQPLIVGLMTQALLLTGCERVLEVGTGSGYQTALLSLLATSVVTVERLVPLARRADEVLVELGYENIVVHAVDETVGWPESAPYDAIIVTAAAPEVPLALLEQLAPGGRLVIPVGSRNLQELVRIIKTPEGAIRHNLGPCRFVPLLGTDAWPDAANS